MGYSVNIKAVNGLPDVDESIVSFSSCPGNMLSAIRDLGLGNLAYIRNRDVAISAITKLIDELDKGNTGYFNDDYCVAAAVRFFLYYKAGYEISYEW